MEAGGCACVPVQIFFGKQFAKLSNPDCFKCIKVRHHPSLEIVLGAKGRRVELIGSYENKCSKGGKSDLQRVFVVN